MAINKEDLAPYWIGTHLSRAFGLNSRFFSRLNKERPVSLNKEILIELRGGIVIVRIPKEFDNMLRAKGYVTTLVENGEEYLYDKILNITAETRIGFWR